MDEPVVLDVVEVRDLPVGSRGDRELVVRWSDGTVSAAVTFYSDEWLVSEGDLVGKTQAEIKHLAHRRDVDYLRDGEQPEGGMPFFDR